MNVNTKNVNAVNFNAVNFNAVNVDATSACCPSVLASPLDEAQAEDLARAYAALADPVRLRLLSLIADAGEICSCEMEEPLGKSQPTISHHTKQLAEAGLITGERRGRWVWWRIVPERMAQLHDSLGARAPVAAG